MAIGLFRGIAACAVAGALLLTAVPATYALEEEPPAQGSTGAEGTLVDRIVEAAESGGTPEQIAEQVALPAEGASSLTFDADQRIAVTVMFAGAPSDEVIASVAALAEIDTVSVKYAAALVRVDPARLAELAGLPGVQMANPTLEPVTSSGSLAAGNAALNIRPAAATPAGLACGPIPIEADSPLRSEEARAAFGVDGTGVTVGIISDSFNIVDDVTSWEEDVASGALPGPGNPCGREIPVEVIGESTDGADEGRAMAQLVHGIAPGAKLLFHTANGGEVAMAMGIDALVSEGADIIVDDIGYGSELTYQQGIISQAIMEARAAGASYFTALGNANAVGARNTPSAGLPIGSWQTAKYRPMACPAWVFSGPQDPLYGATVDCMDFDPTVGETAYDTLNMHRTINESPIQLVTVGSVGEPLLGATTDYEWRYFEAATNGDVTQLGASIPRFSPAEPNFTGVVEAPSGAEVRMVMVRKSFDPAAPLPAVMASYLVGGNGIASRAHLGDGVNDWVGETPLGHAGDGSATSVGALHWDEPTKIRSYSSLGPSTLLFEPALIPMTVPANRLPAPQIVTAPDLTAVDGTQTTFFGEVEGSPGAPQYRFYGTSAAAPNAAAVAALGLSYAPDVSQAELTQLMIDTANPDVVNPYSPRFVDEHVFGSGRVDAMALLEALPERPTVQELSLSGATEAELRFAWDAGSAQRFVIELFEGTMAPENVREAEQLVAGTSAHTFGGLKADTAYTVRLTAYGELGVAGKPSTLESRTLVASGSGDSGSGGGSAAGGGGSDTSDGAGDAGATNRNDSLKNTGSSESLPVLLGAGVILLLGGTAIAIGVRRKNRVDAAAK